MEAMWTACHPIRPGPAGRLRSGEFGTPRHLHAELGFRVERPGGPDAHPPGASALLDMGIYRWRSRHLVLGEAAELHAVGDLSTGRIDLDVAITGRYPGGVLATMTASMTSWSSRRASIATDCGRIDADDFHHPRASRSRRTSRPRHWVFEPGEPVLITPTNPWSGRGYARDRGVGRCLREACARARWCRTPRPWRSCGRWTPCARSSACASGP